MSNRGFSLIELLVGILISLFLAAAMSFFIGNASYEFQSHKSIIKDRGHLKKAMHILSRDLMEIGVFADERGIVDINGTEEFFLDVTDDGSGNMIADYWVPDETMDNLASADPAVTFSWDTVSYQITDVTDPVTGATLTALTRDGVPVLFGLDVFTIELGADLDGDKIIDESLGEWIDTPPTTNDEKESIYGSLLKLRVTLGNRTPIQDGTPVVNSITQEIYLRNRGDL